MLLEPPHVRVAAEEPDQLAHDGRDVHLLRRHEREAGGEVEPHLVPEDAERPGPRAVALLGPLVEHALEEIEVLPHAADGTRAVGWAYCGSFVTRRTNESVAAPTRPVTRQQPTVRNVTPVGWKPSRP